jgi:hypothetical protein
MGMGMGERRQRQMGDGVNVLLTYLLRCAVLSLISCS